MFNSLKTREKKTFILWHLESEKKLILVMVIFQVIIIENSLIHNKILCFRMKLVRLVRIQNKWIPLHFFSFPKILYKIERFSSRFTFQYIEMNEWIYPLFTNDTSKLQCIGQNECFIIFIYFIFKISFFQFLKAIHL